ncbi:hypothetical protein MTR67_031540 [Solanum verrucosum]|uniref:Reverse transcriptase domain-containing protein n=1 Tax=Solanum verrucosum TaxID=315347 RepID=A0AAF0U2M6_SOLVR|nr:hypothetical protein MTR67_031540 [Solanum verrucosum]
MVSEEKNVVINELPEEEEVKNVVFGLNAESAGEPDGYTGKFYQACWNIIAKDMTEMVKSFFCGHELPRALNALHCKEGYKEYGMPKWSPYVNHLAYADDIIIFASADKYSLELIMNTLLEYEKICNLQNKQNREREGEEKQQRWWFIVVIGFHELMELMMFAEDGLREVDQWGRFGCFLVTFWLEKRGSKGWYGSPELASGCEVVYGLFSAGMGRFQVGLVAGRKVGDGGYENGKNWVV